MHAKPPLPLLPLEATLVLGHFPFLVLSAHHLSIPQFSISAPKMLHAGDGCLVRYHRLYSSLRECRETYGGAIAGPDGLCEAARRTGCLLGVVYTRGYRSAAAESGLWAGVQRLGLRGLGAGPGDRGPGHLGGHGRSGSEAISCGSRRNLKKSVVQGSSRLRRLD